MTLEVRVSLFTLLMFQVKTVQMDITSLFALCPTHVAVYERSSLSHTATIPVEPAAVHMHCADELIV